MPFSGIERRRFFFLISLIGIAGLASLGYILSQQRFPNPLRDTYRIQAELSEADGVVGGLGQPVNVAGVQIGSIVGVGRSGDTARITMEIERSRLPQVFANAAISLEPITPLKDMQVDLYPGTKGAGTLGDGATIPVSRSAGPVPLSQLLGALDYDTRDYVEAMINALGTGTKGRGSDLAQMLRALGPTASQVDRITQAVASRQHELTDLVSNLGDVTNAASRDRRLATVVAASNRTLESIASEDPALDAALARLPETLTTTRSTLVHAAEFSKELSPTVRALQPATRRLPGTLDVLGRFSALGARALRADIRPFVRDAQPLAEQLGPAVGGLKEITPDLWGSFQDLNYLVNLLAYNPPGTDEGGLLWLSWFAHNLNGTFGIGDANGGGLRGMVVAPCTAFTQPISDIGRLVRLATGTSNLCPVDKH